VPYVFFNSKYWSDLRRQVREMVRSGRAPSWMEDYILFADSPAQVVEFYRKKLQVL
jgi:predicted Rossmann-fold nucleotide-binding protein